MPGTARARDPVTEEQFLGSLYKGGELLAAGKIVEAREHLEKANQLQPKNEKAQNLLGLTYFKLGLFDQAAGVYELLVRENPADPTLRVNIGLVYLKANSLERAVKEFETATDLEPGHKKAHNYLGLALAQAGDYGRAREHFIAAGSDQMAEKMERAQVARASSTQSSEGMTVPSPPPAKAVAVSSTASQPIIAVAASAPLPPPAAQDDAIEVMSDDEVPSEEPPGEIIVETPSLNADWGAHVPQPPPSGPEIHFEEQLAAAPTPAPAPVEIMHFAREEGRNSLSREDDAAGLPVEAPVVTSSTPDEVELPMVDAVVAMDAPSLPAAVPAWLTVEVAQSAEDTMWVTEHVAEVPLDVPPAPTDERWGEASPLEQDSDQPELEQPLSAASVEQLPEQPTYSDAPDHATTTIEDATVRAQEVFVGGQDDTYSDGPSEQLPAPAALPAQEFLEPVAEVSSSVEVYPTDDASVTEQGFAEPVGDLAAVDSLAEQSFAEPLAETPPADAFSAVEQATWGEATPTAFAEAPVEQAYAAVESAFEPPGDEAAFQASNQAYAEVPNDQPYAQQDEPYSEAFGDQPNPEAGYEAQPVEQPYLDQYTQSEQPAANPGDGAGYAPMVPQRLGELGAQNDWVQSPSEGAFQLGPSGLAVTVTSQMLMRMTGLVAVVGSVQVVPEHRRKRGRPTGEPFGTGPAQLQRVTGNGVLYLEAEQARFHAVDLTDQPEVSVDDNGAYLREEFVFAFEEAISFENGRLSEAGMALDLVHLKGHGRVLLALPGALKAMPVPVGAPMVVPLGRLVGWFGRVSPRLIGFGGQGAVELTGEGFALLGTPTS